MEKQLSIFVPVYNVEKYIYPCMESIQQQGLLGDDYEIIVVNDGTPDRSMEQITDLIDSHSNITVINHENQGQAVARNNGLARATGVYFFFVDSDDLLIDGSLPLLLDKAMASQPDMIVADFISTDDEEIASLPPHPDIQIPINDIVWEDMTDRKQFEAPVGYHSIWHTLHKRTFLVENGILFQPGNVCEDLPFTYECCLKAGICLKTNLRLNIYRRWYGSLTKNFNMRYANDLCIAIGMTWVLRKQLLLPPEEYKGLQRILFVPLNFVTTSAIKHLPRLSDRLQVMDYLAEFASDLRFSDGYNQKAISLWYRISPHLLMMIWTQRQNRKKGE